MLIAAHSPTHLLVVREYRRPQPVWKLPGGRVELGEGPEEAAVRELAEETGWSLPPPFSFLHSRTVPSSPHAFKQYLYEKRLPHSEIAPYARRIHEQHWGNEHFEVTAMGLDRILLMNDFLEDHRTVLKEAGILRPR